MYNRTAFLETHCNWRHQLAVSCFNQVGLFLPCTCSSAIVKGAVTLKNNNTLEYADAIRYSVTAF